MQPAVKQRSGCGTATTATFQRHESRLSEPALRASVLDEKAGVGTDGPGIVGINPGHP
jgi:hypothetical protein